MNINIVTVKNNVDKVNLRGDFVKIIIDPGHGGKDPGGGNNEYWKEKDMNLKISLYQYERFKDLGINVEMTRKRDIYLSQEERTKKVRGSGAEICISNHINSAYNKSAQGVEIIHSIYTDGTLAGLIMEELKVMGAKGRRVFSKTHPNMPGKDYYYMNRLTGNVETVIVEYGFASNREDSKRILDNWQQYAEAVVAGVCEYINYPYNKDINYTKIIGKSEVTLRKMQDWARNNKATEKFIGAAEKYIKYGEITGIRADILYSQSGKETNFGRYTGVVTEDMNNFAGIKVKNPTGDQSKDHERFLTVDDGVRGHFNHMCAYVGIEPVGKVHDRYFVVKSLSWAGKVKYVKQLGGKWAPDPRYGISIIEDYLTKLLNTTVEYNDYKVLYENCKKENAVLKESIRELRNKLEKIATIAEV
ncbi:N-acetylmuramoyl-L-alanine amidase [Dethiothermospora halolimnae]|uniref:N-acetylmuramoyl-L-alanine amidase n=1 Tax=Dethiothermospora halolimnae TaxID=3114390 RepID=UPI003CCC3D8E